jgi:PAT family beta-lactamase induction signal transducer AmpG
VILCLYGYQGLVAGFAFNAIPNLHASLGETPGAIGAYVALVGLPWTLQPLWGPVVDRFGASRLGRRRPWVLAGLGGALASLALLPMAGEGPGSLALLGPLLCLHSVFAALLDTAADGMIMDRVPDHRLGQATAHTRMGFALGSAAGAAIFAWLLPAIGLPRAAMVLLALGAAAGALALLVREAPPGEAAAQHPQTGQGFATLLRALGAALLRREALALLAFCIAVEFAVGAFGVSLSVAMVQAGGWDPAALSRLQGLLALVGGTAGAAAVGWWSDRAGHGRVLVALLLVCCTAHLVAALLLRGGRLPAPARPWRSPCPASRPRCSSWRWHRA